MRVAPLYLASAVMFWAWHAQVPLLGVAMAAVLEAPRWARARWRIGAAEFARIADLCTWAFVILAGYLTFTKGMPLPILKIFQWLPLVWLPLMAAQLFSAAGRMPLSALFLMLRPGKNAAPEDRDIDLGYPYAAVCALSAGAANLRDESYYAGLLVLAAWGLWQVRPAHGNRYAWVAMFACAGALGYAGQLELNRLQQFVMESTTSYFGGGTHTDPYRSTTDIGQIGELKQSDRIVLRATLPPGMKTPLLLHRASYNVYASQTWLARDASFIAVGAEPDRSSWVLSGNAAAEAADARGVASRIVVSQRVERGNAVLALPNGTVRIEGLPVPEMQRNPLGAVMVEGHAELAAYQVVFDANARSRTVPREADLRVPRQEAGVLEQVATRLQLHGRPPREVLAIVGKYFARDFAYSTYLPAMRQQATPLADFLLNTRAGHCEYFATAATLLLRTAGVPARYATGYSVQEWSALENSHIVRERHAHAWVRAWVDGRWIDFDTTPPVWFSAEAQGAPRTERVSDVWSWAAYRFTRWQGENPATYRSAALAVVALLAAILIWRLLIRRPFAAVRHHGVSVAVKSPPPGADSEFYQIEARLARAGCTRGPQESLRAWLARIARERGEISVAPLRELLQLHYRYRFDPHGLSAAEREILAAEARRWLRMNASFR